MSRELKRVALDFTWPLRQVWEGYRQPPSPACAPCAECGGDGYSETGRLMKQRWYGYVPFCPEERGSVPFTPQDRAVWAFAERNVRHSPAFYGVGHVDFNREADFNDQERDGVRRAIHREAERLCALFNTQWSHHLNADDVAALLAAGRLTDLTHTHDAVNGYQPKVPAPVPTPAEVNAWSIEGMGHDSLNQWIVAEAECKRLGVEETCAACAGEGERWASPEDKAAHEAWEATPPPAGEGYQMWETVSEGSPISPVFAEPEALAEWLAQHRQGTVDEGTTAGQWLALIQGTGWAPSTVRLGDGPVLTGVQAFSAP